MSRKKNKLSKGKKKFFIIAACYVLTFIVTSLITVSTMAWFNSSTWQSETLYMGGPVYMHFSDDSGNRTSGAGKLVTQTPPGWEKLYPGMNINFEAKAVMEGGEFTHERYNGETFVQYTTGGVLRARIMLEVVDPITGLPKKDPDPNPDPELDMVVPEANLYEALWDQLYLWALNDTSNDGFWVFDEIDTETKQNNYFYYVSEGQLDTTTPDKLLLEVGGRNENISVGFLNNAVIQIPAIDLTNYHADTILTFTIVFEAVQAFFPYEREDIGTPYQGDTTGRDPLVTEQDVGLAKPLTIKNARKLFNESMWIPENGYPLEP